MKKYADCNTGLGPGIDKNGLPVTGLTEDMEVPNPSGRSNTVVPGTRRAMERELDLAEGTLKQTSKFWGSYYIKLDSEPMELVLNQPHDLLKYLFALGQSNVANSLADINKSSQTEFVLYSEEQEAKTRVEGRRALKEAYILSEKLDLETKVKILSVYGEVVDSTSPNTIIDRLEERLEEDPAKFLKIAKDNKLVIRALLSQVLDKAILTTKNGAIYHGDVVVGHTEELAVEAIAKDETLRTILKAKLSGDMDLIAEAISGEKAKA
jgi:hypothetical protein